MFSSLYKCYAALHYALCKWAPVINVEMDFVTNFSSDKTVPVVPIETEPAEVQKHQPCNTKLRPEVAVGICHTD
jgi:hypothetical protein